MDLSARISAHFEASAQLKVALAELLADPIAQSAQMIVDAILNEKKVLSCGNGAGAANAQYFSSRMLGHYEMERPGLASIALSADSTTITAIANLGNFDQAYAKQVQALGQSGDILLAIEGKPVIDSGTMLNLIAALKPNQRATVQIARAQAIINISIVIGKRPKPTDVVSE